MVDETIEVMTADHADMTATGDAAHPRPSAIPQGPRIIQATGEDIFEQDLYRDPAP